MMNLQLLKFLIGLAFLSSVSCSDFIPNKKCATLYSDDNYDGEKFILHDFDQVVSTKRDFRHSVNGWNKTGSVRLETGCDVHACDDTYFTGHCTLLTANGDPESSVVSEIQSANCTCERQCSCESVSLPHSIHKQGRAYLHGGCRKCDTEYIPLFNLHGNVDYSHLVEAIKIRPGCNITLYSDPNLEGESRLIQEEITEDFHGTFRSYEIDCDDYEHQHQNTHSGHDNGNSTKERRNVNILFIGHLLPSYILGITVCNSHFDAPIKECHIPVHSDTLDAELRIIFYDDRYMDSVEDDYQIIASLDDYLSHHEELNSIKPNAVIVSQRITTNNFDKADSQFQRKLKVLNALRHKIVDEEYSNIFYLLRNEDLYTKSSMNRRYPEKTVSLAERIIKSWEFPKPMTVITHQTPKGLHTLVNGFRKQENQEYWPMNMRDNLLRDMKNTGDLTGHEVYLAAFQEDKISFNVSLTTNDWLPKSHPLVSHYRTCLTEANPPQNCTNISGKRLGTLADNEAGSNCATAQAKYLELAQRISVLEEQQSESDKEKLLEQRVAGLEKVLG